MADDTCEIRLANERGVFVIDISDAVLVARYRWQLQKDDHTDYARGRLDGKHGTEILAHRLIMAAPVGMKVDHINGDGLDNRRSNLRLATNAQNCRNRRSGNKGTSSQYLGVNWERKLGKWKAQICVNNQKIYLGIHLVEQDAARAYDAAAAEYFGEFAHLNFPAPSTDGLMRLF